MSFDAEESSVSGQLRIAAIAIAAYEIIRTAPLEYRYYTQKGSTPALLVLTRYAGIATLVANASLYFSSYTESSCHSVHLLPGILQLFMALAVQVVIFYRTLDVSSRTNKTALSIMIFAMIISVPLEAVSVGLNRQATLFANELTKHNGCLSLVQSGNFNIGPVFYLARLVFDLFSIFLCSYYLVKRGGWAGITARLINTGLVLMLLDAFVNLLTFLASLGVNGIENIGSMWSIVTSTLIAQHILFLNMPVSPESTEYRHEVLPLPNAVYKASDAQNFQSTGTLPRFATPSRRTPQTPYSGVSPTPYDRSKQSLDGGASVLHSCVGREALKYRTDGDVNMFQSKTSLCALEELKAPIPLDVKRLSQQTRKSRPATGDSSEGDNTN